MYNLGDELVQAEKRDITGGGNTLTDRETWGLDDGGNWLNRTRTTGNLMETRSIDVMNRLTQIGGAGSAVIEGNVNEQASVTINGQPAEMRQDAVAGGYRFKGTVPVIQGSNTVAINATDTDTPAQVTNQNWKFTVPAVTRSFTYDNNGNTLTDGVRTMSWDSKNRLKTVTKAGVTYKWDYDYRDRRVREYQGSTLTKIFIWSGNDIIQERNASNAVTRTHYFGGYTNNGASTGYQIFTDHLGNVRELWSTFAVSGGRFDYSPYGAPTKIGTGQDPTFLTIGRYYHHAGSGLELALYRAYDPELGRWMSEDPIGEAGGVNLYEYSRNMPSTKIDLLGLIDWGPGTESTKKEIESTEFGRQAIKAIKDLEDLSKKAGRNLVCKVQITRTSQSKASPDGTVLLNPQDSAPNKFYRSDSGPTNITSGQIAVHEFGHVYQHWTGTNPDLYKQKLPGWENACERDATQQWENRYLRSQNKPDRIDHSVISR
jgi:RHS repeat-associated protein